MAVIEIAGLSKSYRVYQKSEGLRASIGGLFHRRHRLVEAVRGIDLTIKGGEFVAFLGPNGAGKTTTLKLLSGVLTPTSGSAMVLGHVPWKRENAYRRRFALVMGQKNQLWWDLPAAESFRLHQQIYRIGRDQFERSRDELTALLSVGNLLSQPVRELSLGERMKMELIAALLHSPEVLFLDEPTIGLDVVAQYAIQSFLRHYQEDRKVTIVLTSHYMKDVAALCRRVVIIAAGKIIYDGSLGGIIDRFGGHKVITLQFSDGRIPGGLERYGNVVSQEPPRVKLRAARSVVPEVLAALLARHTVEDVSVEDPPLEEAIAEMFAQAAPQQPPERQVGQVPELLKEEQLLARATTWWTILRISLEERLIYRGDFALGTLMRFLPIVTQIFLWSAVFETVSGSGGQPGARPSIAGYTYHDFVAYYLLTMITRAFSSMPGLASGIARDIREGTVKKYLIQPIDMLSFLLLYRVAHKLVYYVVAALPFALVYFLCRGYFHGWPDAVTMLAFLASLTLAFLLGFYLEATLGMIGFWFLEVSSLLFVYMLFNFFFSGHMFPLDMLPGVWGHLVRALPLQYLAYYPAAVFLGKVRGAELAWGLLIELGWVLVFVATSRLAFHYGVRRYSAYGG